MAIGTHITITIEEECSCRIWTDSINLFKYSYVLYLTIPCIRNRIVLELCDIVILSTHEHHSIAVFLWCNSRGRSYVRRVRSWYRINLATSWPQGIDKSYENQCANNTGNTINHGHIGLRHNSSYLICHILRTTYNVVTLLDANILVGGNLHTIHHRTIAAAIIVDINLTILAHTY